MPRPGWGPAPQGAQPWAGHAGPSMPPEQWFRQAPPHPAPGGHADGFSAMAAPLESASGQPIGPSFFNGGGGGMPMHGMHGGGMEQQWERDEEGEERREAWADFAERQEAEGHNQWAHWGPEQGHGQRPAWAQDPNAGWGHEGAALMRTHSHGQHKSPGKKKKKRTTSFSGGQGGWGTPAAFDEHHLSQRPEDWRDGYSPRGISGADISFSSLFRVGKKSDSKGTLVYPHQSHI